MTFSLKVARTSVGSATSVAPAAGLWRVTAGAVVSSGGRGEGPAGTASQPRGGPGPAPIPVVSSGSAGRGLPAPEAVLWLVFPGRAALPRSSGGAVGVRDP